MSGMMITIKAGEKFKIGNQLVLVESVGKSRAKLFCPGNGENGHGEKIVLLGRKDPLTGTIWEGR